MVVWGKASLIGVGFKVQFIKIKLDVVTTDCESGLGNVTGQGAGIWSPRQWRQEILAAFYPQCYIDQIQWENGFFNG